MDDPRYKMQLITEMSDVRIKENSQGKSYIKAIVTGHVIEIYEYEKLPTLPDRRKLEKKKKDRPVWLQEIERQAKELENRRGNMQKARNRLRRLITANFDEHSKFITLTFKENLTDVKKANYEYMKFIQRLRYRYGDFKYIAVIEFQKRGAVHYHMISNLPYIDNSKLCEIWGQGFVKINDIRHVDNVGAYMIKYMTKDIHDERLRGLKSYQTSKNLVRPKEYTGEQVEQIVRFYGLETKKAVFTNSYENEHLGMATYKEFNLKRLKT